MANLVFETMRSSFSPKMVLLSECPRMTHSSPMSLRCLALTSPVYAPKLKLEAFWAATR